MKHTYTWVVMVFSLIILSSCKDEIAKITFDETVKDVTGNWKVLQLTRNGEDLSKRLDLTDFYINFKSDGSYRLSQELPFITNENGSYTLSDPQYPFSLILQPDSETDAIPVKFQFPIINGERQLSLIFSLGCTTNTYQFNFERQN